MKKQYEEVITFLEELGLEKLSKEEKKSIYERIAETGDLKIVKQDLEILSRRMVHVISSQQLSISVHNRLSHRLVPDNRRMVGVLSFRRSLLCSPTQL